MFCVLHFLSAGYRQRADTLKPYSQKTSQSNHTRTTALSNSMKLSHACGATQDGRVMVQRSDRMWSTGEGNGKPLQYSCLENPMNSMKRQNDRIPKKELPRSLGAQYATGDQWRNNSRKNEGMEPKQKQYPAVDEVTQLCTTLSDPMDCSPPGSSVHGIFQGRVLKCGAIAFT